MVPHINYCKDYIVHILIVDVWPALITIGGFAVMLLQFSQKTKSLPTENFTILHVLTISNNKMFPLAK